MIINLIRHGKTEGNLLHKYIGKTDEPLCDEGKKEILNKSYPYTEHIFTSPLKRCTETAELIYPKREYIIADELKECDFGDFEGKSYEELKKDVRYRNWISDGGLIPNGESTDTFRKRCVDGFFKVVEYCRKNNFDNISIVCHGGTIMSVMEKITDKGFYEWQIKNAEGFRVVYDAENNITESVERLF